MTANFRVHLVTQVQLRMLVRIGRGDAGPQPVVVLGGRA
eukprot:COSAG02_NODE_27335_length_612_cov_0.703704_3_plen_38_part_01